MSVKTSSLMVLSLLMSGCVGGLHRQYQPADAVYCRENLKQYFLEFSDQGFFWEEEQLSAIVRSIHRVRRAGGRPLVLVFVHGWKHSAKETDKYVKLFRESLLNPLLANGLTAGRPVIAVYVGWSGFSTRILFLKQLNFFARYATASRIGQGPDFPFALRQISLAAKGPLGAAPIGNVVVGGHSMGSTILQQALVNLLPTRLEVFDGQNERLSESSPADLPDLVLFLNSAASSLQMVKVLIQLHRLPIQKTVTMGECEVAVPLLISLSSVEDKATRRLFPISRRLELYPGARKKKNTTRPFPYSEESYWRITDGNNPDLISHIITSGNACILGDRVLVSSGHIDYLPLRSLAGGSASSLVEHCLIRESEPLDENLWVVAVPGSLSKSHDDIFSGEMVMVLSALVSLGIEAAPNAMTCISEMREAPNPTVPPDG